MCQNQDILQPSGNIYCIRYRRYTECLFHLSVRKSFVIADALLGGTPITVSSGGGGSTSGLPWDERKPDEEENSDRRRCLLFAVGVVKRQNGMKSHRRK